MVRVAEGGMVGEGMGVGALGGGVGVQVAALGGVAAEAAGGAADSSPGDAGCHCVVQLCGSCAEGAEQIDGRDTAAKFDDGCVIQQPCDIDLSCVRDDDVPCCMTLLLISVDGGQGVHLRGL